MKYLLCNWKCSLTRTEAVALARRLAALPQPRQTTTVVFPSQIHLDAVGQAVKGSAVKLGAQKIGFGESAAETGETSPAQLKEVGAKFVLIGHSEQRQLFGESVPQLEKRLQAAAKANLHMVYCVGETQAERAAGKTEKILKEQLALVKGIKEKLIIAYEPVWAIGTGNAASAKDIADAHAYIRTQADAPVVYGGSVDAKNAKEIVATVGVDGVLVGSASTKAASLSGIVREFL